MLVHQDEIKNKETKITCLQNTIKELEEDIRDKLNDQDYYINEIEDNKLAISTL